MDVAQLAAEHDGDGVFLQAAADRGQHVGHGHSVASKERTEPSGRVTRTMGGSRFI